MIYGLLRWITGIALHWFYNDIRIVGAEKNSSGRPITDRGQSSERAG